MHTPLVDKSPHRRDSAGGRLKQRLARILTRSTCTTNATSATAAAAAGSGGTGTAFVSLAKTNANADSSHPRERPEAPPSPYFCTPCTYERPRAVVGVGDGGGTRPRRRRSRSASLIHISVDCTGGAGAVSGRRSVHSDVAPLLQHLMSSVPARDVVRKQSRGGRKPAARSPSASRRHCSSPSSSWGRARRPSGTPTPYSYSWSSSFSTATDDELAPFSGSGSDEEGGDEAETRTLFSSLSFSSDSTSDFYHTNGGGGGGSTRTRRSHGNTTSHRPGRRRAPRRRALSRASDPPAAPPPDAFRPLVVSVETTKKKHSRECDERNRQQEEKGRRLNVGNLMAGGAAAAEETTARGGAEGTAVVKRSSNPYLDFRSSMVEMVVERRIGSVAKMEELLGSYLSLNSPRHHPAILAAFEDVWEAVFGEE